MRVGEELAPRTYRVTRADLVRYAGASGDFNPIHWNDRFAKSVGLPGVIAHGMFTMALAGRALVEWIPDPGAIVDFGVRFTRPVPVPDDEDGTSLEVTGVVRESPEQGCVRIDLNVRCAGEKVLGQAKATVRVGEARLGKLA